MIHVEPRELSVRDVHWLLLGGVAPRPIALVSTISASGTVNLSPFSFYNAFGANPPVVAFSPSTRGRDGTKKDTYRNIMETRECVIQAVTYDLVQQVSLASTEFLPEIDEFVKAGLTPEPSDLVRPPRVKESPFQMECRLMQMVPLGDGPVSGNLAICEVVKFHAADDLFERGIIVPDRIDLVGRNSGNWYTRASGAAVFEVPKPTERHGIGVDRLPDHIRTSRILSGNNLAQLAGVEAVPTAEEARRVLSGLDRSVAPEVSAEAFSRAARRNDFEAMLAIAASVTDLPRDEQRHLLELTAKTALDEGDVYFGWAALLLIVD